MEKKIIDILDNLTIEQTERLIDENMKMKINGKDRSRIKKAVFEKIGSKNERIEKIKKHTFKWSIKSRLITITSLAAAFVIAFLAVSTGFFQNQAHVFASENLMEGIERKDVAGNTIDNQFIAATQKFSIELLKQSISHQKQKDINTLVSPMSVYLALGMASNGADNETLKQFEKVLGDGKISIGDLNGYYYTLQQKLQKNESVKLNIANSIWYRKENGFVPKMDFLQANANYYGAAAYQKDFDSPRTVDNINDWVKKNTDGLIEKILDEISPDSMMYLINTVLFDAEWEEPYLKDKVRKGTFNLNNSQTINTDFMSSTESVYLRDETAQGFMKPYKDNKYSFVAMLPNEGIDINTFIKSLDPEKFTAFLKNRSEETVYTSIPKLKYSYENDLLKSLQGMGIKDAFNVSADFRKMSNTDLYISKVLHKTYIQVDEKGTKAGAAALVEMTKKGAAIYDKKVELNKPFVYAIIDNETNLPIFLGTVLDPALR